MQLSKATKRSGSTVSNMFRLGKPRLSKEPLTNLWCLHDNVGVPEGHQEICLTIFQQLPTDVQVHRAENLLIGTWMDRNPLI